MKNISTQIVVAMFAGIVLGIILNSVNSALPEKSGVIYSLFFSNHGLVGILHFLGDVFVRALKMMVVPIVFVSLAHGASQIGASNLGKIGTQTLGMYLMTTAVAITLALVTAIIVDPGSYISISADATNWQAPEAPSLRDVIVGIVPVNPIAALVNGDMLAIIFFALLFGVCVALVGKEAGTIADGLGSVNAVFMRMITLVISFAPYGVFCLLTVVFFREGTDVLKGLAAYFFVVLAVLVVHLSAVYLTLCKLVARLSPVQFLRNIWRNLIFAFSTSSSNATLPVSLETAHKNNGVDPQLAAFTIPFGATINLDGTAIMQGTATVFIASAYGIDLQVSDYILVIFTATLASIGTAGVPSAGLVLLALVLEQAGLPVEGIALILGVDRLLDMSRTAVNVCGDQVITLCVARMNGMHEEKVFNQD